MGFGIRPLLTDRRRLYARLTNGSFAPNLGRPEGLSHGPKAVIRPRTFRPAQKELISRRLPAVEQPTYSWFQRAVAQTQPSTASHRLPDVDHLA